VTLPESDNTDQLYCAIPQLRAYSGRMAGRREVSSTGSSALAPMGTGIDGVPVADLDEAVTWSVPTTLGQVLESLGLGVLDVVAAPSGLGISVGETVVHGAGEPVAERPRGILLATGAGLGSGDFEADVRAAATAGYAAVVVKRYGADPSPLAAVAGNAGIALLTTPDEMSWRHLDSLLGATAPVGVGSVDRYAAVGSGDLFSLANAVAAAVGGAVTIEDPDGHVLAYSNLPHQGTDEIRRSAILGRQTPERPTNRQEYQSVFAQRGPVTFASSGPGHAGRVAIGLWAGRQPLGIIWVINDRPPLVPGARELLIDAARVSELQLLRMRGSRDPDRGRRTQVLRGVLDGRIDSEGVRSDLGMESAGSCRLLAIGPRGGPFDGEPTAQRGASVPARIVDLVTLFCDGWDPRSLCVAIDDTVYALIPARAPGSASWVGATPGPHLRMTDIAGHGRAPDPGPHGRVPYGLGRVSRMDPDAQLSRIRRLGHEITATARRSADLEVIVAIGPTVESAASVAIARAMVDRVLEVQRSRFRRPGRQQPQPVATLEDVLPTVILKTIADRLRSEENPMLASVEAMLDADATGGTPYAETILAYLGTLGDYAKTAALLTVHENTVRYRIRRARELFRVNFDDPDTTLVAWLQLRLAEWQPTGRSGPNESGDGEAILS
jgi:hypothetical protein